MSVNQSVIAYYGWLLPTSKAVLQWADDLDYQLPEGVQLLNIDSTDMVFGVKLFESGSNRWGIMEGDNISLTQTEIYQRFMYWFDNGGESLIKQFADNSWEDHRLHIYINSY